MQSTVMRNLQTLTLLPILALANFFVKIVGSVPIHPVLTGPDMAYLNTGVTFHCIAHNTFPPVTYELMRDSVVLFVSGPDLHGDQPTSFYLKVTEASEGSYYCRAKTEGSTAVSNRIKLTVVTPPSNTRVTSEPSLPVVYEGSRIVLSCNVAKGSHLSYTWFFNREKVTSSGSPLFGLSGNKLVLEKVTPEQTGQYACIAWARVRDNERSSSSAEVQVIVKVYISTPKISFSMSKEGDRYYGNVSCWSSRGSPPVNFSLTVNDREVGSFTANEAPAAWFRVAMVPGLDMGTAQCRVKTEMQELISDPVILEVVPVGGDVKVEVEHLYRADSKLAATRLSCQISRGTFPYISWLFNDSILPSQTQVDSHIQPDLPHYVLADRGRTLFLTKLGPEEFGYYCCRARDHYDESAPWVGSAAVLVQITEVFTKTTEIVTIVFCCFLLLMLAVGVACVYRMLDHKKAVARATRTNASIYVPFTSQPGQNFFYSSMMARIRSSRSHYDTRGSSNASLLRTNDHYFFSNVCLFLLLCWMFASLFMVIVGVCHCSKQNIFRGHLQLSGPSVALVHAVETFKCELLNYTQNETVLFKLLRREPDKSLGEYSSLAGEAGTFSLSMKTSYEGDLECVASLQSDNSTFLSVSNLHHLKVIVPVEGAEVLVHYEALEDIFEGMPLELQCTITAGTHVSYRWLLNDVPISPSPSHSVSHKSLTIKRSTSKDSGSYVCVASNFNNTVHSPARVIEFKVPVAGPVKLHYDYNMGENYAVTSVIYYCSAAKGSHPQYRWFLNGNLLDARGRFYSVENQPPERSMLLVSVGSSTTGTYHCEVSDNFDKLTSVSSRKLNLNKEAINRLPDLVVGVVFGCFLFLILLVSVCCWIGVVFRRRHFGDISMVGLDMGKRVAANEAELDVLGFIEDEDLVKTGSGDQFDQASQVSQDEWPQIVEEKKTLEDIPVEFF
ncbi:hypothetical protein Q5P01_026255 [Channa striata]|uniref:Ig-like domain-containing protein n=1 Tax=Channa striata TaxID=64152 RepID=A0AA88IG16_CHASR|nr:hypothetical protein Q5P01_026255 [Channa striata]